MQFIQPKVYHIAHTTLIPDGVQSYLDALDIPDWVTDAPSDVEKLIEIMGRGCYRSFQPGMNKNVTKIREGNEPYLANIVKTAHGSVVEHAADSYILLDVSRVLTHELVRHRIGTAFSQESLRYVRLDALKAWFPKVFQDHPKADFLRTFMQNKFETMESWQRILADELEIDSIKDFNTKKKLTSAMRRFAPIGLATMIGFSGNHRAMRFCLQQRTAESAEEEIRIVFGHIAREQANCYPNLYRDMKEEMVDGIERYTFENHKI
jgi:thymidylate synthase (FAD)